MTKNRNLLPAPLYTAEQTAALDNEAINRFNLPGIRLMRRAGHAVFNELLVRFPKIKRLTIFCGSGNNGGDGFVIAALAYYKNIKVQLICVGKDDFPRQLRGEALQAWQQLQEVNTAYEIYNDDICIEGEVIVDALLGTGLSGQVRGDFALAIDKINLAERPVCAVDIPSGICADTGKVLGVAVRADFTLSFIGLKRGLLIAEAVDYCGEVLFDDLKIPEEVYGRVAVNVFRTTAGDLKNLFPKRLKSAHKGKFGQVLVVGGNKGMGGAALLAASAAVFSGAGRVSLATKAEHISASLSRCPEIMVQAVESRANLLPLLDKADIVVIGPGLGQDAWAEQMLQLVLAANKPMVIDADALNLVAKGNYGWVSNKTSICTPHLGEAARILGETIDSLRQNPFTTIVKLQQFCGGAVVLKGAGSLISAGEAIYLCDAGNPGMATAGMGDVLSGICGAFMAQGLTAEISARLAVYVHAVAADRLADTYGEVGLAASDLLRIIPRIINGR